MKKYYLYAVVIIAFTIKFHAMETDKKVFFDNNSIIKQSKLARANEIASQLPSSWFIPQLAKLPWYIGKYFHVNPLSEQEVENALFNFYRKIQMHKEYLTTYHGTVDLPPFMTAWLVNDITSGKFQKKVKIYLDNQQIDRDEKKFYEALAYGTVDPNVMAKTCYLDRDAKKILTECKKRKIPVYLMGNWDAESFESLKTKNEELEDFDKHILFSSSCKLPSPYRPFLEQVVKTFDNKNAHKLAANKANRIYIVPKDSIIFSEQSPFTSVHEFSQHIYHPSSKELLRLIKEG